MTPTLIFGGLFFFFILLLVVGAGGKGEQTMTDLFDKELDRRKREN